MRLGRFRAALAALQPPPDQALPAAPELAAKREEVHALQARFTQVRAFPSGAGSYIAVHLRLHYAHGMHCWNAGNSSIGSHALPMIR
jgi:hypothetical protein